VRNKSLGDVGKRKVKYRMSTAYAKGEEGKREDLAGAEWLAKDRKLFQIWLKQSNA